MKKPTGAQDQEPERDARPRALAASLPKLTAKALGKHGFTEGALITDWAMIVGDDLARVSQPEKLSFPRGERVGGVLRIRVQGSVATELQHLEPLVVERINSHFGYGAVAKLKLIQAPLTRRNARRPAVKPAAIDPIQKTALRELLGRVDDDETRAVLERIGTAILQRENRRNPSR